MIRDARFIDIPRLVEMGMQFINESPYSAHIRPHAGAIAELVRNLIGSKSGLVLVYERHQAVLGMIGVVATNHPYTGAPVMSEMFWYVEPDARGTGHRLLEAAEEWARGQGIEHSVMISPSEKVSRYYERIGYAPLESQYIKRL